MENITLGQIAAAIGLIAVIGGALIAIAKFGFKYEKRFITIEGKIETLESKSKVNDQENRLMLKGLLACLKGLKEQGCNGPVTQSIEEIDDYLIKK